MVVPAFVYRLERCNAADVAAITWFIDVHNLQPPAPDPPFPPGVPSFVRQSKVLNVLINLSEMWYHDDDGGGGDGDDGDDDDDDEPRPPTVEQLRKRDEAALFSTGASLEAGILKEMGFPTYRPDDYWKILADPPYKVFAVAFPSLGKSKLQLWVPGGGILASFSRPIHPSRNDLRNRRIWGL